MRKLEHYRQGTIPVGVIPQAGCSFCGELKECITPIAIAPHQNYTPFLCKDCATDAVKVLKKYGAIPGQKAPARSIGPSEETDPF